jgi:hypothetical protein
MTDSFRTWPLGAGEDVLVLLRSGHPLEQPAGQVGGPPETAISAEIPALTVTIGVTPERNSGVTPAARYADL